MTANSSFYDKILVFLKYALPLVAVMMFVYHMTYTQNILQMSTQHQATHLLLGATLTFWTVILQLLQQERRKPLLLVLLTVVWLAGIVAAGYIEIFAASIEARQGFGNTTDLIMGSLLILMIWVGCWYSFGPVLTILSVAAAAYFFMGHLIPGYLGHGYIPPKNVMSFLALGFSGVFGDYMMASADYIFLYMVFGALLAASGGERFFVGLGRMVSRVIAGGSGQTAVVSSGLLGMVTGVAVAEVGITGSFTIPAMKKEGYSAEEAGAIESVAATGGQIMPPVMGIAAFLMAILVGVPYIEICKAALLSAILYYIAAVLGVRALALKRNITGALKEAGLGLPPVSGREMLRLSPIFIIPLGLMIYLLLLRYSVMFVAFWAIVTVLVLSLAQKITRKSPKEYVAAITKGATWGGQIAIASGTIGILAKALITTGLVAKVGMIFETVSFGVPLIYAFWVMVFAILLGCGAPTLAAYALVAAVMGPSMVNYLGISMMQGHMFMQYFAIISAITPPVAAACMAACKISGGDYIRTGIEASKLGIGLFLVPYFFIHDPALLLAPGSTLQQIVFIFLLALIDIWLLAAAVQGYALTRLTLWERAVYGAGAVLLVLYVVTGRGTWTTAVVAGIGIMIFMTVRELVKRKRIRAAS